MVSKLDSAHRNYSLPNLPYTFPNTSLISSLDYDSQKSVEKSLTEEETTKIAKFDLKILYQELSSNFKASSVDESFSKSSNLPQSNNSLETMKKIIKMKSNLVNLDNFNHQRKLALQRIDSENSNLSTKKEILLQKLREKFRKTNSIRSTYNCCFF